MTYLPHRKAKDSTYVRVRLFNVIYVTHNCATSSIIEIPSSIEHIQLTEREKKIM
jgi:hypothetical protein